MSLWQTPNTPETAIISTLEEALNNSKSKFTELFKLKVKKTVLQNEIFGTVEVHFAETPTQSKTESLNYIDTLLTQLENKNKDKTILLLIDEVQHLATSDAFSTLAHSLRTLLDKRQGKVKSILTGSSRHYMNMLLNESTSPFYNFSERLPWQELDDGFITFIRDKISTSARAFVDKKVLMEAFIKLDLSPYWMLKMVSHYILNKTTIDASLSYILEMINETENFPSLLEKLKDIDILTFKAIANNKSIFSKEFLEQVEQETNIKGIPANVQRSVQRLIKLNLISKQNSNEYYIEKTGFKNYLDDKK